jgi:mannose-6-phosphate isomerase-like protein (cupin superfamily)
MQQSNIFEKVAQQVQEKGFNIVSQDTQRPWGGFYVIDESQAPKFVQTYFPELSMADFAGFDKLSPKILMVAPGKRLSWQYHHRRAEIWRLIEGVAGVVISDTDEETELKRLQVGDKVVLAQGERHRLVGLEGWGVVAEIWQHTDAANPSNEDDIVRLQDDFSRK